MPRGDDPSPRLLCRSAPRSLRSLAAPAAAMVKLPEIPVPVAGNPADRLLSLPIEDSAYDGARKCTPKASRPGMLALQRWLEANARGVFWGSYRCEKWGKGQASLHAENRAIDWHLDASEQRRRARRREADPAAARARHGRQPAGARAPHGRGGADLGLRVLGCRDDRVQRSTARATASAASSSASVNKTVAHRDHVHIGMTKRGAAARTSLLEPRPVIRRHTRRMRRSALLAVPARPRPDRRRLPGDRRGRRGREEGPDRQARGAHARRQAAAAAEEAARARRAARGRRRRRRRARRARAGPGPRRSRPEADRPGQLRRPAGRRACSAASTGRASTKATALSNGVALPPLEAPEAVRQIIEAGNSIARTPYKWGGGHGKWQDTGYDCSGSVSFALAAAGLLDGAAGVRAADVLGQAGQGQVGHDLLQPRPRLPRGRGHPLRHLRPARDGLALDERRCAPNAGFVARHPPGL